MDAVVPQDVRRAAYGQAVWSCPADAGDQVLRDDSQATVAKKPVHRGDHGAAVKPLRRECRSDFGVPVLACVRLFCFARKAVGASCTRHSLRPLFFEGQRYSQNPDANRAAGMRSRALSPCRPSFETRPTAAPRMRSVQVVRC